MSEVTVSRLDGLYKEIYSETLPDLIPRESLLQKHIKFQSAEKQIGNTFNFPVRLTDSTGFTFAGPKAGVFSLNGAISLQTKNAQIEGSQIVLRDQMDYESAARAVNSKAAFKEATSYIIEGMQLSHRKMLEIELLYGQDELGVIGSVSGSGPYDVVVAAAEWAPKIWSGLEGAKIQVWDAALSVAKHPAGGFTLSEVDIESRTLELTGTPANALAADDRIFLLGQYSGSAFNSVVGVHKILTNAGSLFGINAADYSLWKSISHAASGAASLAKIGSAAAKAVAKGLDGEVMLMCSLPTFQNLVDDQAALVRHATQNGKKAKFVNGADSLEFHAVNGMIKVVPSGMVKEGYAYGLCLDEWKRIGAVDYTNKIPGMGEKMFHQLESSAGFELRSYSNQAICTHAPGKNFIVTGIVNS
jgi:hypothetical protein